MYYIYNTSATLVRHKYRNAGAFAFTNHVASLLLGVHNRYEDLVIAKGELLEVVA